MGVRKRSCRAIHRALSKACQFQYYLRGRVWVLCPWAIIMSWINEPKCYEPSAKFRRQRTSSLQHDSQHSQPTEYWVLSAECNGYWARHVTELYDINVKLSSGHIRILLQPPIRKACGVIVSGVGFVVEFRDLYKLHEPAAIYRNVATFWNQSRCTLLCTDYQG